MAAAFTVHVALAVAAGSLLTLLPHRPLEIIVGVLFAAAAVLLLRGRSLLKVIPLTWITRTAAVVMLVLAGISLAEALA